MMLTHLNVETNTVSFFSQYSELRKKIAVTFDGKGKYTLDSFYKRKKIPELLQLNLESCLEYVFSAKNNIILSTKETTTLSAPFELSTMRVFPFSRQFNSALSLIEITGINFFLNKSRNYAMRLKYTENHPEKALSIFKKIERTQTINAILESL